MSNYGFNMIRFKTFSIISLTLVSGFYAFSSDLKIKTDERLPYSSANVEVVSAAVPQIQKNDFTEIIKQRQFLYRTELAEEELAAAACLQQMDRESAARWTASFISCKPWNCPIRNQRQWIEAIIYAVEKNGIPLCKEIIGLTAGIIAIESGFHVDPPAIDPGRGETLANLLDRAEQEVLQKYGTLMSIPPVPQLYQSYKDRYYQKLAACRTEGDIEKVAGYMADDLRKDIAVFPEVVRKVIDREIDKLANIVRTKGSMQLNFPRARELMLLRGEVFSDRELLEYVYTMNGGVDVGVAALKPMFLQYAARYGSSNLSWLFFVGMDYHYGPFSSRNMMEQVRIRDLSGIKLNIDGDFLNYDERGHPGSKESQTLKTALNLFPKFNKSLVHEAFLLEKTPFYAYTDVHKAIANTHKERFGDTPFAVIGELTMNGSAQLKHGLTWKTRRYLNKLDKMLNALPWDQ